MRARRTDDNHREIIAAYRALGFAVYDTSRLGGGFPDLLVYRPREGLILVEVKDGRKKPSARKLTKAEKEFAEVFPVRVVESVEDVIEGGRDLWRQWV